MSAKSDFRKAQHLVHQAETLIKRHLDAYLYAQTFEDLDHLIHDLDVLANEGATQPTTKPP